MVYYLQLLNLQMPNPSWGKVVMEVGSMVVSTEEISGQMPDPSRGKAMMEVGSMVVLTEEIFGHDIPSTDPLVGGDIPIAPIVVSHTEVNILKFHFFNTC